MNKNKITKYAALVLAVLCLVPILKIWFYPSSQIGGDEGERINQVKELGRRGEDRYRDALVETLKTDSSEIVRKECLDALASIHWNGHPSKVFETAIFQDTSISVRILAYQELIRLNIGRAYRITPKLLKEKNAPLQTGILATLLKDQFLWGWQIQKEVTQLAVGNESLYVRLLAAENLAYRGNSKGIELLVPIYKDLKNSLKTSSEGLTLLGEARKFAVLKIDPAVWESIGSDMTSENEVELLRYIDWFFENSRLLIWNQERTTWTIN